MTDSHLWGGDDARLDRVLVDLGIVRSRSHATTRIAAGAARVGGQVATKPGARVRRGDTVSVAGVDHYVSRGAHKLIAALDEFEIDATNRLALDIGASTGGFTQVLLERGSREVLSVDVGHDQLSPLLREDPRVRVVEGCNARGLTAASLAELTGVSEQPSLIVADLSFISLTLVLPAMAACAAPGADLALLIKPQFEVGRVRDGVVTDPLLWQDAIRIVLRAAGENGFATHALAPSPIAGGEGNREFLVHLERGGSTDPQEWDGRIAELCAPPATPPTTPSEGNPA